MIAAKIAAAKLGGASREGRDWRCCCPVHGGRSLTLRDGRDGRLLVRCWAGCDARHVLAELRRLRLSGDDCRTADATDGRADDRRDHARRIEIARCIWSKARDARGTPVARYLAGRGITIPVPHSLRWAPVLRRPDGTSGPAMVARVDSLDGELIGVHRTWLDRDDRGQWHRRDRASLGPVAGGAVRLAPAAETLLIGEGVETTMAGMAITGLAGWAALSAGGIERLILPGAVREVLIAVDRDQNGTGERGARAAAARWLDEGRRLRLLIPHVIGADIADLIQQRCIHHAA